MAADTACIKLRNAHISPVQAGSYGGTYRRVNLCLVLADLNFL